jgi:hypothetical protein
MNLNCRLTLTDEQRNNIKRNLTGKNVKALATRAEICELVNDLLEAFTSPPRPTREEPQVDPAEYRGADYGDDEPDQAEINFCSDDCCRRNELLQRRVNILQHRIDTQ